MLSHLRAHRPFARPVLVLALVPCLLSCLLPLACDRDTPTDASSREPLARASAASSPASASASAPSPPPLPPPLDFELEQRFSHPLYADFAALVIPDAQLPHRDDLDDAPAPAPPRIQPLLPASTPTVTADAEIDVAHRGIAIVDTKGRSAEIRLLGVRIDAEGRKEAAHWVSRALRKGRVIVSSDRWGTTRAGSLVLVPGDSIVLNVELLRHGFARLDHEHAEVLRSFPLLADAAWEALEHRTGLARDWSEDEAYVAAVAALR